MPGSWCFKPPERPSVQGRGLAEDNFSEESRTPISTLLRESLQNPLDARPTESTKPVHVRFQLLHKEQVDVEYLNRLFNKEYLERFETATGGSLDTSCENGCVLVIEDFGTTGLLGNYEDPDVDGDDQNWNAFWFREGEGAKPGGANGRAGQGKITYYRTGGARAVLGLSVRSSDKKKLLMGRSSLNRDYLFTDKIKYKRDAFWCIKRESDGHAMPVEDSAEIDSFCHAFGIRRKDNPGLSLVIPFPDLAGFEEAVKTVITEFYYPIANGRLEVEINSQEIRAENIEDLAAELLPDSEIARLKSCFTAGLRMLVRDVINDNTEGKTPITLLPGWDSSSVLDTSAFPPSTVDGLRETLDKGERVSVRFPVYVKPKKGAPIPTYFDVHIEMPDDLERVTEGYIRRDLLIGSESPLANSPHLPKARALTLIEEKELSAFLADAEEPNHLRWNASRPRLKEDYKSPDGLIRAVRQAAPRLLSFLSGRTLKRDKKALAKFFSKVVPEGTKGKTHGDGTDGKKTDPPPPHPPPPQPKPFTLDTGNDWVKVSDNNKAPIAETELPVSCILEMAYETLDGDPFHAYDPFDFDLADATIHELENEGVEIINRILNRVEFKVMAQKFYLKVNGFDRNIRLKTRLDYTEMRDETAVETE